MKMKLLQKNRLMATVSILLALQGASVTANAVTYLFNPSTGEGGYESVAVNNNYQYYDVTAFHLDSRNYNFGVIRFDDLFGDLEGQISHSSVITSATMDFNIYQGGSQLYVGQIDAQYYGWETGVASRADLIDGSRIIGGSAAPGYIDTLGTENLQGLVSIDITSQVSQWKNDPLSNAGISVYTRFGERNDNGYFAGLARVSMGNLTITAVPEPSSTALLGLGGLALMLRRRR